LNPRVLEGEICTIDVRCQAFESENPPQFKIKRETLRMVSITLMTQTIGPKIKVGIGLIQGACPTSHGPIYSQYGFQYVALP